MNTRASRKHPSFAPFLTALVRGLGVALALAFAGAPARAADNAGITLSVVGLGELPPSLLYKDGGRTLALDIPTSGRGAPVAYGGSPPLVLFKEVVDATGNKTTVPVATVEFSPSWTRVLAVLVSGGKADSPIRALAFDDGAAGFPAGYARLFNFYASDIAVSNNGRISEVASGKSALLPLVNHSGRAWMKLATRNGAGWSSLPTFVTQIKPDDRLLVFAYEIRTESGIQQVYRTITQNLPPPKPAGADVAMR